MILGGSGRKSLCARIYLDDGREHYVLYTLYLVSLFSDGDVAKEYCNLNHTSYSRNIL